MLGEVTTSLLDPISKLKTRYEDPRVQQAFSSMYSKYNSSSSPFVDWASLSALADSEVPKLSTLAPFAALGQQALNRVAVLKLNGGLGTSMGCTGPKSLIPVKGDQHFLDVILAQVQAARQESAAKLPLVLMNSPYTHTQTLEALLPYQSTPNIYCFEQHLFPRLRAEDGSAFSFPNDPIKEWYPPGHGNLYLALLTSGICDQLLEMDVSTLFISNSDNLGAKLDTAILGYMQDQNLEFVMEITPKTQLDIKGGILAKVKQQLSLVERAQVDEANQTDFEDLAVFPYFNTNTIWLNLDALKQKITALTHELPLIVNPKTVEGDAVIQLETAMGAGIAHFERAGVVCVERDRFMPVKHQSDLERLREKLESANLL